MKPKKIVAVFAGIRIPEFGENACGENACNGNFRGGLEDLAGHVVEGAAKIGLEIIPITYFYPVHWRTDEPIDYSRTSAQLQYNLDVDIHYQTKSVPIYTVSRSGVKVYGINDPDAGKLYPGDDGKKQRQAAFLGRAVHALLRKMNLKPDIVWCNEWLTSLVIPNLKDDPFFEGVKYLFTLHTLAPEALLKLPKERFRDFAINAKYLSAFSSDDIVDPSLAGVALADMVNGVSPENGELCQARYPEHTQKIKGFLNGVSVDHVLSHHAKTNNEVDPTAFGIWRAHLSDKEDLIREVELLTKDPAVPDSGVKLDPTMFTIGLCRRLTEWKNEIIFRDIRKAICAKRREVVGGRRGLEANLIIAGVAHENDTLCRAWMEEMKEWMNEDGLRGKLVYIPNYSERLRELVTRGADVHVECPWPGWEACGTSNMLAKINGNPNVATRGGGIKTHGTEFDPATKTGDTLFIEPYNAETLYLKLKKCSGWFYKWVEEDDELWLALRMNNFLGGKELDVSKMMEEYNTQCFEPLLNGIQNAA
ncbi:MAG: glycogen/starch synthase [bacterium]|nr:glycogen/starch synthase [bacterium]